MEISRERIRILLGSEPKDVELGDPNTTLLDYLRYHQRLTGTKEGCAEGDCGACTVLIGELVSNKLQYRSANACIILLGMLDGKQILTVEHIATSKPISQVPNWMATKNGSQCGFCTPGFVISLVGLQWLINTKNPLPDTIDRSTINEHLAGNLCRCTGYGPIIDTAQTTCRLPLPKSWHKQASYAETTLLKWQQEKTSVLCHTNSGVIAAPRSENNLNNLLAQYPNATILAGATDIGLWVTKLGRKLRDVIYLGQVEELQRITRKQESLEIGGCVSLHEAKERLVEIAPDLNRLLRRFGSKQIRSQATVCGNIANGSPIGDLSPALIALGSTLRIAGIFGVRDIPLEKFFIEYNQQNLERGEYIQSVTIPIISKRQFYCWKIYKRFDQDISAVLGAFSAVIDNEVISEIHICFGGMAGTPKRASKCEKKLVGTKVNEICLKKAQDILHEDFSPITDMRAGKEYRLNVSKNLLEKFVLSLQRKKFPDLFRGMD